jgi:hypothetical protein
MSDILSLLITATEQDVVIWISPPPADLANNLKYISTFNDYIFRFFGSAGAVDRLHILQKGEIISEFGSSLELLIEAVKKQSARRNSSQMETLEQSLQDALDS